MVQKEGKRIVLVILIKAFICFWHVARLFSLPGTMTQYYVIMRLARAIGFVRSKTLIAERNKTLH